MRPTTRRTALVLVALTFSVSIAIVGRTGLRLMLVGLWLALTIMLLRLPTTPRTSAENRPRADRP